MISAPRTPKAKVERHIIMIAVLRKAPAAVLNSPSSLRNFSTRSHRRLRPNEIARKEAKREAYLMKLWKKETQEVSLTSDWPEFDEELSSSMTAVEAPPAPLCAADLLFAKHQKSIEEFRSVQKIFKPGSLLEDHFGPYFKVPPSSDTTPHIAFPGDIHVINSSEEEAEFADVMRNWKIVGIDSEHLPGRERGEENPTALFQLATPKTALLYRLRSDSAFPPGLSEILASKDVIKVGHDVRQDLSKWKRDKVYDGTMSSVIDTELLARKLGLRRSNLKNCCHLLLQKRLSKKQQQSNWESKELSAAQMCYAATDAWIVVEVLMALYGLNSRVQSQIEVISNLSNRAIASLSNELLERTE